MKKTCAEMRIEIRKQAGTRMCFLGLFCLAAGLFLAGCAKREITKNVVLEEKNGTLGENEYAVKNIKEYFYEGTRKDENWMAWEKNTENIYILKYVKGGYEFQKIDMGRGKIISKLPIEIEDTVKNAKIAPNGKCIAYVTEFALGVELYLYDIESNTRLFIGGASEITFEWSGNGRKLFYLLVEKDKKNVSKTWSLRCSDVDDRLAPDTILRTEGDDGGRKVILPDMDGSQVYIFNEEKDKDENAVDWLFLLEDNSQEQNASNLPKAVVNVEPQNTIKLSKEITRPIRYTKAGLFAQGNDGTLYLVTNLLHEPEIKTIARMDSEQIFICDKGDHIFELKHEDNTEQSEIRSMYLEKAEVAANRLLYKDVYRRWTDAVVSMDDSAIMLKSCEHLGEKKYSFKITLLEYGDT